MKKQPKLNISRKTFDKELARGVSDLEYTYFYEYLYDSKYIKKN
jgi:hypothetical protein